LWKRPLQDAQRAMRLIRSRAEDWHLDPSKIGILGFSAGGQVALLAALVVWGARGVSDAADQLRGIAFVVVIALPLLVASAVLTVPEGRREGFRHQRLEGFLVGHDEAFDQPDRARQGQKHAEPKGGSKASQGYVLPPCMGQGPPAHW